jgi:hypothetical protein
MSFKIHIEETPDYLVARFIGPGTPAEASRQFESIAEHCKRANKNKLLLDFTEASGKISLAERYFFAEKARIFAQYGLKVAGVDKPEQLDPKRFCELVAWNRGVNIRAFTDIKSAEEWLLKQ